MPAFDASKITVIFVLGGPGSGKGTQCDNLVTDFGFKHLSAGDLLREEKSRDGSPLKAKIEYWIKEGMVVPQEVLVQLLTDAMTATLANPPPFAPGSTLADAWSGGRGRFLIDGYPRAMDQALMFDANVVQSKFVLFMNTSEDVMRQRMVQRGRGDDNDETIWKRFVTFHNTSLPVVEHYRSEGKVVDVDASPAPEAVYAQIKAALAQRLGV
ncbi:uncharacterized protein EHS24_008130 [Apiotrichum porosum]|uniref:Uncharacterized protein n=1 Tax=Apiotrichum porosum TaxID=105984 RepID=A0A427XSZ4_9TREE|nr:uncharacterized protein EHS24_008130 [Apiotrichum porosum]RSH81933.1 hypothetical protein EHS24_008130 [Apiotrichum porosum]